MVDVKALHADPDGPFTVAVLKDVDYALWHRRNLDGEVPFAIPYGLEALVERGARVTWSDADHRWPWTTRMLRKVRDVAEHRSGLRILNPVLSLPKVAHASVTLTLLEDSGLFLAMRRRRALWRALTSPLVMVSCWLAEECQHFDDARLTWHRAALTGTDGIILLSANQKEIFCERLAVPRERLHVVPFGINHHFYAPQNGSDDGYVLSAGQDRGRDYEVLIGAVRDSGWSVKLVCPPQAVSGVVLPPNVEFVGRVPPARYRDLLARARVVVVPTHAPAYPSGQSVMLEAMACGRCCVVTDSPAMRDYVEPDVNAILVPPRDPVALRAAIDRALHDEELRSRVGRTARQLVEERFNYQAMWTAIGRTIVAIASDEVSHRKRPDRA